ncbi:uncharacterized protein LOC110863635 [Folsomia candida]|uniref:uncharacterized protein LOC110863635 n=1 Tax=Folsomia candida TaxID=158441 RepID=UPI001604CFAF|nr:uncharacterized protein LOC110863635 [Folsomia candida]
MGVTGTFLFATIIMVVSTKSAFGASMEKPCTLAYHSRTVRLELLDSSDSLTASIQNDENVAIIPSGKQVRLECINEKQIFRDLEAGTVELFCAGGTLSHTGAGAQDIDQLLECRSPRAAPFGELIRNGTCVNNASNIDVYVTSDSGESSHLYSVCFDEVTSTTLYSKSYIDGKLLAGGKPDPSKRPGEFQDPGFFPFNVVLAYKQKQEKITLTKLLGEEKFEEYFPKQTYYLSRGHLFPNGDPYYKYQKDGTFFYINVVPQWQILNNGNWKAIEDSFRQMSAKLASHVNVYTGTHGVVELKNQDEEDVELWMGLPIKSGDKVKRLPVPKFLWKIAYSEVEDAAVALVQINNPWATIAAEDYLCKDICDQLDWLSLTKKQRGSIQKGFTYCCDVNELRKKIETIPVFKYSKVLESAQPSKVVSNLEEEDEDWDDDEESDEDEEDEE